SVWRILGDEDFFAVCASYIATHPSVSYNLSDYGREFPDFLAATAHAVDVPLLGELARFELAFHDIFHAPAHHSVDVAELASLGDLAGVRLRFGSAVQLVACERAVYDVFRHRHDAEPPDLDLERPQWVLLFKQHGDVLAREVDAATFA
ncbi:MAG: putative DNA-binding domain-containing protein, partial [Candidatus Binatia bacterium]